MGKYLHAKVAPKSINELKLNFRTNVEIKERQTFYAIVKKVSEEKNTLIIINHNESKMWFDYHDCLYYYFFKENEKVVQ